MSRNPKRTREHMRQWCPSGHEKTPDNSVVRYTNVKTKIGLYVRCKTCLKLQDETYQSSGKANIAKQALRERQKQNDSG